MSGETMNVKLFRQRVSQVYESEVEINEWLSEMGDTIEVKILFAFSLLFYFGSL